ncbi:DUF2927 family protein [Rhodovulum visakhapatnamense]|uniref:DUF2927 family protein n=2 Tax=Rhodovulum visakhapatnamense TaxID=364297 RepID=A0A4V3GTT2_9RHOB|nr:DUF2927 domain-containing protein [Rhodovulum visakhapatnamense]TDX28227.1 DUF2927 family protein [Rhodovulum visakhapatnamense]
MTPKSRPSFRPGLGPGALASALAVALAGCQMAPAPPETRPAARPAEAVQPELSPDSQALARHYARVQADLLSRGLLRTDGGETDVPFTRRALVENFVRIALFDEYVSRGGHLVARETESRLRRWEQPVRFGITFGATIPAAQRTRDRAEIAAYVRRLARVTGMPMWVTSPEQANFQVFIVNEDERRRLGGDLERLIPGIDVAAQSTIAVMPRSTFCLVLAFSKGESSTYSSAVAVIRGEHPDRLRQSCVHEELSQGLGLANDNPSVRPSIFNDDEEFALLTPHDELLLKMLYDRRLRPGMTPAEARPIVEQMAAELMGGDA